MRVKNSLGEAPLQVRQAGHTGQLEAEPELDDGEGVGLRQRQVPRQELAHQAPHRAVEPVEAAVPEVVRRSPGR